ncbi:hypothetical protein KR093_011655, partial [Drosophila rubida]
IKFPLPPHTDESICRDEFLQQILAQYDVEEDVELDWIDPIQRHTRTRATITGGTMEAIAIMRRLQTVATPSETLTIEEPEKVRQLTPLEKRVLMDYFMVRFQQASVEYLSVRLKKRLVVFSNIWSAETSEMPHNLFKWASSYFLARSGVNQLYLDVLTIEKSATELNCNKFITDVNEIIEILDAIRDDVRNDRDLCEGSLKLMNDMNYEVKADWVVELSRSRREQERLTRSTNRYTCDGENDLSRGIRFSYDKVHDATIPIERRYHINWLRSVGDQYLLRVQSKQNALQSQLTELNQLIEENVMAFDSRELVYQLEIDKHRTSIVKWEEQLEVEMEELVLQGNVTRHLLGKAKDDLQFHMELMETYKAKVAAVLEMDDDELLSERRKRRT